MKPKINYPGKPKRKYKAPVNYANRGKFFENAIVSTNNGYAARGMGYVIKLDPPIQIQQTLPSNKIIGFKKEKGFVDFCGLAHGRAVAFDAKETKETKRFDLKNIKDHQMLALEKWDNMGGISFFLIFFTNLNECYLIKYAQVREWWDKAQAGGRKSIPYEYFLLHCDLVRNGRGVPFDYLKVIGI